MAPLHGAVALTEREHRAVCVGEELDLDVAGPLDVALAEDGAVAERRLGLAAAAASASASSSGSRTTRMPRPPPPAAALTSSG